MSEAWLDDVPPIAKGADPDDARSVFLAWERLRVVYNLLLVAETLLLGFPLLGELRFWMSAVVGAVVANVLFCLGIWAEGMLEILGCRRSAARSVVFLAGLVIAVGLAFLTVMTHRMFFATVTGMV